MPLPLAVAAPSHGSFWHLFLVGVIVLVALAFDFINGFHDSANSIATLVSTRALDPKRAVIWAAFFNFLAAFVLGLSVAGTIATKIVDPKIATSNIVFCALIGAIGWNLITWWLGIPSSSSHALIGGFVGAGLVFGGPDVVHWKGLLLPLAGIVLAPTLCLVIGYMVMVPLTWICRNTKPSKVNKAFKRLQFVSAAIYSLSHGGNDAQKTIGIIAALLVGEGLLVPKNAAAGLTGHDIPFWIIFFSYAAIGFGTLLGGWRIVKTMGSGITKLRPIDGFAASLAGGLCITGFTEFGLPVSTTHSIAGSIMGVGATKRLSAVRWGISAQIIWAWVLTIPASALIAMGCYGLTRLGERLLAWIS